MNIYSFCNIHDVSWGTKGSVQARDLGSAKSADNDKENIVTIVPGVSEELNETYLNTLESLRTLPPPPLEVNNKKRKDDSYYAFIRTVTVLVWMLTNAILIAIVLEAGGVDTLTSSDSTSISGNSEIFLTIILWIVAGLAAFRFIGSSVYLILKVFRPLKWRIRARKAARTQNY